MITTLYIVMILVLGFMLLRSKTFYEVSEVLFYGLLILVAGLHKFRFMLVLLHALILFLGCTYIILAIYSEIHNRACTDIYLSKFKFMLRNRSLGERQKYFRVNCYVAIEGILSIIFGVLGLLIPDSIFGFIQID